jgi:hypothetical protein
VALTVQNDAGSVADANSYLTEEELLAYHADRGNTLGTTVTTSQALIQATDYLDGRFNYKGLRLNGPTQATAWPRCQVYDKDGRGVYGIPKAVKEATAEYALRASRGTLNTDPDVSATGARIQSTSQKAGELEESVTYAQGGEFTLPEYPAADSKLRKAGLVQGQTSGRVSRG